MQSSVSQTNDYVNLIIRPVCSMEEQLGQTSWIERVPSQPNPADKLSRERPVRFRGLMPMVVNRRPDGSVGMALVWPALTVCRWFESLLVHSGVSSATRREATGANHKRSLPTSASHRNCTGHARDASLRKKADTKRSSPYQEYSFSMDGECKLPSPFRPMCCKRKTCRTEGHRVQMPPMREKRPGNLKTRHEIYWQRHTRIKQKTARAHAELLFEQLFEHVNISKSWWIGTAKSFMKYKWPPESTHNKVKKQ